MSNLLRNAFKAKSAFAVRVEGVWIYESRPNIISLVYVSKLFLAYSAFLFIYVRCVLVMFEHVKNFIVEPVTVIVRHFFSQGFIVLGNVVSHLL